MLSPEGLEFCSSSFGHEEFSDAKAALGPLVACHSTSVLLVVSGRLPGQTVLFLLQFLFLGFYTSLGFRVGAVDNGQSQVQEEKGTDEYDSNKEEEHCRMVCLLIHDNGLTPAFKCDTLEDVQKGPEDIVKVGHIVVRIERLLATEITARTFFVATNDLNTIVIEQCHACVDLDASLENHAHEKVESTDAEDEHEEDQDEDCVLQKCNSTSY